MKLLNRSAAVLLTGLLAACNSGGGTSTPSVSATPQATLPPTAGAGTTNMSVTGPSRLPASSGSSVTPITSIVAYISSINGSSNLPSGVNPTTQLNANAGTGGNCTLTNGVEACTFALAAPSGSETATITYFAGSSAVATNTVTFTSTGLAGQTTTEPLGGIVTNVAVGTPQLTLGTASTNPLTVTASDSSGAVIGGTNAYANPITLTDNDTSGATQLRISGAGSAASTVTSTAPSNTVNVVYNGGAYSAFTVSAAAAQATIAQPISATSAHLAVYHGN